LLPPEDTLSPPDARVAVSPIATTLVPGANATAPAPEPEPEPSPGATPGALVALRAEEAARTSSFGLALALLSGAGLLVHLALYRGGVPLLRHAMTASLLVMEAVGLAVWRVARDPRRYSTRVNIVFGLACIPTSFVVTLYLGVFSPFACLIALGLSVFGLIDERRVVLPICVALAAAYFGLALAVTFGVVHDPGLFSPAAPSRAERLGMAMMVLGVFSVALWHARRARAATLEAVARSNQAVLAARQREALLAEAHQHLDAALRAGAGAGGRWTGTVIGRYRLGPLIGRGAMGEVYAAQHESTGAAAAVKLMHAPALSDPSAVRRFLRETELAARLRVPNVVEVLDAGEAPDGTPYLAMELLTGHDLAWHLRQRRRLPPGEVVAMVEQVARGLRAAHDAGIVHRDLKPQNIVLHERAPDPPIWKILDFGVSKLRAPGSTLTEGNAIIGTPGYLAPEQVQEGRADTRSDVFALGVVAYRALTGQPAFSGHDVQALFEVVAKQPAAPSELVPRLPRDVDRALALALAKREKDRLGDPLELAQALRAAVRGELPEHLRARADGLVRAWPWGSEKWAHTRVQE
jgi:serine/threonine-protein kinase